MAEPLGVFMRRAVCDVHGVGRSYRVGDVGYEGLGELVVVVCNLGWPRWCHGGLSASSAGYGRGTYPCHVQLVACLVIKAFSGWPTMAEPLGVSMRRAVCDAHGVGRSCRGQRCRLWRPGADIECALMDMLEQGNGLDEFGWFHLH